MPLDSSCRAKFGELGDRLATKGSTKVAEEDEEEWAVSRNGSDGFAGLRVVRLQQLRVDALCREHGLNLC